MTDNIDLLISHGVVHCKNLVSCTSPQTPATEERLSNSASDASMLSSRASSPSTALTSASPEGDTRTMRDIFDSVNKKRLEEGIEVFNLSAGMVEVEPCPELLQQAAFAVLSPLCSSKEVPWLHMYRERKGDALLRQELANLHSSGRYGPRKQNVDAGNVLICSGVSAAIASIFGAWRSNHGSQYRPRIVLFVPYYTCECPKAFSHSHYGESQLLTAC